MRTLNPLLALTAPIALTGCSAMTTITASQPDTTVTIPNSPKSGSATPRTESFSTTSFGNYEFRAEAPGFDTFYGILPLKFNGGYLAADILLFAPAMFFNLREVYAFYEFDLTKKQVLYKQKPTEEWSIFVPLEADAAQGREAFAPKK